MNNSFFKKTLLLVTAVFSLSTLASCQNSNKAKLDDEFKIQDDLSGNQPSQPYETVNNEQDAIAINKQAQEKSQEVEVQDRVFFGYDSFDISTESKKFLILKLHG